MNEQGPRVPGSHDNYLEASRSTVSSNRLFEKRFMDQSDDDDGEHDMIIG